MVYPLLIYLSQHANRNIPRDEGQLMTAPQLETQEFDLLGRDDAPLKIKARLLGFATSKREIHTHDDIFTRESEIEKEIDFWEDRLTDLPKRFPEDVLTRCRTAITEYLNELDTADAPRRFAAPGDRCSACRWFEVRIFDVESYWNSERNSWVNGDKYLVLTHGLSDVPGEVAKRRAQWTNSPYTVLEVLTQRRGQSAFLPATSAKVLAEASGNDVDIRDAYVNRAVA